MQLPFRHTSERKKVEGLLLNTSHCYIRSFLYFLLVAFCLFLASGSWGPQQKSGHENSFCSSAQSTSVIILFDVVDGKRETINEVIYRQLLDALIY